MTMLTTTTVGNSSLLPSNEVVEGNVFSHVGTPRSGLLPSHGPLPPPKICQDCRQAGGWHSTEMPHEAKRAKTEQKEKKQQHNNKAIRLSVLPSVTHRYIDTSNI